MRAVVLGYHYSRITFLIPSLEGRCILLERLREVAEAISRFRHEEHQVSAARAREVLLVTRMVAVVGMTRHAVEVTLEESHQLFKLQTITNDLEPAIVLERDPV